MKNWIRPQKCTLAVMAIFRNEAHILAEWCEHYISQGAEKIYLINHLSTDDYQAQIAPYQAAGIVDLSHAVGDHPQLKSYNALRRDIKRTSRWLLPCDLDEFVYARHGNTLKSYLDYLPWQVSEVIVPWKNFGSSNHHDHPEGLVTQNFLHRKHYAEDGPSNGTSAEKPDNWCKYVVRTSRIRYLAVHYSSVWYGKVIDANARPIRSYNGTLPISEASLSSANLHLNHYPIQSLEYFTTVKMKRPDVNCPIRDTSKDLAYFQQADRNEVHDPELSHLWSTYPRRSERPASPIASRSSEQPAMTTKGLS